MEEEVLKSYEEARGVSDKVMGLAKMMVKENAKVLDIAEAIEERIKKLGAKPAWPVNISINENAAHYTPDINDPLVMRVDDFVKVDIGVHVNGYIWDRAFTVCIGKKSHPLVEASEKGLKSALKAIKSGVRVYEISEIVEDTVTGLGFNPIRNLCGHGLEQYNQHAPPSIPNGKNTIQDEVKDQVVAMEVFTTTGSGWVKESRPILIYRYRQDKPVRLWEARQILEKSKVEFERLPFARRWLKAISPVKIDMALRQLLDVDAISGYPILREVTNGPVAQTEETVIVG